MIISLLNSMIQRNDQVTKFLVTKTAISQSPILKQEVVISSLLKIKYKSELIEEIITSLRIEDEVTLMKGLISVLWEGGVPDEFFLKYLENISNINKPVVLEFRNDLGEVTRKEKISILGEAINSGHFGVAQALVNKGADVDSLNLYTTAYEQGMEFFEVLVSSNKSIKPLDMEEIKVEYDDQFFPSLSDIYDFIKWKII